LAQPYEVTTSLYCFLECSFYTTW